MSESIRYPHVRVQLTGTDGNVYFLVARVRRALRQAGVDDVMQTAFEDEVFASDSYDAALCVIMHWVSVA